MVSTVRLAEGGLLARMQSAAHQLRSNEKLHAAFCITGIVGCLMVYGVLQERIMTEPFGHEGEVFKYSLFLVLCNRLLTCGIAFLYLVVTGGDMKPVGPIYNYAAVSVSNVVATTCQYEALRYVSFPVQTLGKTAKMIPVMLWGTWILRKNYSPKDYGVAVSITIGCTIFLLSGDIKSKQAGSLFDSSTYGICLMLGYLLFDGFTSTWQDSLFKGYQMSIFNQMLYVTLCSAAVSAIGLISAGQWAPAIAFVDRHPAAWVSIIGLSLAATIGQLFITHTIRQFGALLFATVMTTRQFLSILLSCLLFGHPLTLPQWGGTAAVFAALYFKTFWHGKAGSHSSLGSHKGNGDKVAVRAGEEQAALLPKSKGVDSLPA